MEFRVRNVEEVRAEALEYIRTKWPDAEWSQVYGRIESEILNARRDEQGCAKCMATGERWCRKGRGYITAVCRKDYDGQPVYTVTSQYCPHGVPDEDIESRFNRLVSKSGLKPEQLSQTFANYNLAGTNETIRTAKALAIRAAQTGSWLTLAGQRGTGKTSLAVAIALEAMRKGKQAYFWLVSEMLDRLRAGCGNGTYETQMAALKEVPCLVLDDLGKERNTQSDAGYDFLYQIVDARYRAKLQTIITTNARNARELASWGDEDYLIPIASRMVEMGEWLTIERAQDYRVRLAGVRAERVA